MHIAYQPVVDSEAWTRENCYFACDAGKSNISTAASVSVQWLASVVDFMRYSIRDRVLGRCRSFILPERPRLWETR